MKNKILYGLLIVFVSFAILGGLIFLFKNQKNFEKNQKNQQEFSNSYITGYEGDFWKITYRFLYPKDKFVIKSKVTLPSKVLIKEISSGKTSSISFFYNDAAGFKSAKELWENQYKSQCPNCLEIKPKFSYPSKDIVAFANLSEEWIIFSQKPGFVIANFKKPSDLLIKILETLEVYQTKTEPPKFLSVKVYFVNSNIKENNCKNLTFVERQIIETPKIATAALELLLEGPSQKEMEQGYRSEIPPNSEINSLVIKDQTAYIDFNSTIESGGGSCSMEARVEQIRQTLFQFPTIKKVVISINQKTEPIFQP
jgi:hypothetical protein